MQIMASVIKLILLNLWGGTSACVYICLHVCVGAQCICCLHVEA